MKEIEDNDFRLRILRHVNTTLDGPEVDVAETHRRLVAIDLKVRAATKKHNNFLRELGLQPLL
jgi:type I restriction enzyme M protein